MQLIMRRSSGIAWKFLVDKPWFRAIVSYKQNKELDMYTLAAMFVGAVIGAIVMDLLWALRLGIPQAMWHHRTQHNED